MDISLLRATILLSEQSQYDADYLDTDKNFKRLAELIPPDVIKDLKVAWAGDIKELERNKKADSLFQMMMKASTMTNKYKVNVTPEISKILGILGSLAIHLFSGSSARGAANAKAAGDDRWGYSWGRRESIETIEQDMLYEQLKQELIGA